MYTIIDHKEQFISSLSFFILFIFGLFKFLEMSIHNILENASFSNFLEKVSKNSRFRWKFVPDEAFSMQMFQRVFKSRIIMFISLVLTAVKVTDLSSYVSLSLMFILKHVKCMKTFMIWLQFNQCSLAIYYVFRLFRQ